MRYNLRYEKNLIPVDTDFKLWLGMVVHKALEAWHGVTGEFEVRKEFALAKIDECCKGYETDADKRKTRLIATEMMISYMETYRNDIFEVIAIEHEFEGVVRNPKTGWKSKTFNLKGKADGIVKTGRGLFLLEHKTTIRLMESPEDQLWNDTQTGIYVAYLRDLGYDIVGVLYNELPKCSLIQRKGETEEEFQLRHAELCAKNKSGTTTEKRQLPETDEEYAERVRQWYQAENRFRRTELFLSKTQIDLVKQDVWGMTQQFPDARRRNDWFCNRENCVTLFGPCPYRRYCQSNYCEEVKREMFEVSATPHTEFDAFNTPEASNETD